MNSMPLDQLPGRSVLDITGRVLGRIDRFVVDLETWAISALRVKLRRASAEILGVEWSPFRPPTLDVPTGLIMGARDAVLLRVHLDELHRLITGIESPDRVDDRAAAG